MLGPVLYLFLYHNSRRVCNIARIIMSMQHSSLADDNRVPLEDLESGGSTGSHDPQAGSAADRAKRSESETEVRYPISYIYAGYFFHIVYAITFIHCCMVMQCVGTLQGTPATSIV